MKHPQPHLLSLNVGMPRHLGTKADGTPFVSSIARQPVEGAIRLGRGGFEGDACNWSGHHGEAMAVNVFAIEHYATFEELGGKTLPRPAFGENLTLSGYTDTEACVGDVVRVGSALLQVSQPREPCGNLVRFLELPRIVRWMEERRETGFYFRVLEPGVVAPDSTMQIEERGHPEWTIATLSDLMYGGKATEDQFRIVSEIPSLSSNWKSSLIRRAKRAQPQANLKAGETK
jgi:MOSC domain-containing protein YiiM